MILHNKPYIICEGYAEFSDLKLTDQNLNGKVVAEVILQTADERNRNGRYYSKDELFPQLTCPRITELLTTGTLKCESGHPLSKDLQRQSTIVDSNCCARILKLWTEGNDVKALVVATNNELGKAFDLDLKEGVKPAWSLRALGSVEQTRRGAEVHNLRVITWDSVIYPSHTRAYTQRLMTESSPLHIHADPELLNEADESLNESTMEPSITIIDKESVIKYVMSESADLKFLKECFDFVYSDISVNKNGTKVLMTTNEGDTLVVPLDSYIHNELMHYAEDHIIR
jgi:hypothetical protein